VKIKTVLVDDLASDDLLWLFINRVDVTLRLCYRWWWPNRRREVV